MHARSIRILLLAMTASAASNANAMEYTWTGLGEGVNPRQWGQPDNWEPPGIPGPDDTATIHVDIGAAISASLVTVKELRLNAGYIVGSLTVDGTDSDPGSLIWTGGTIAGQLTIGSNAVADFGVPGMNSHMIIDGGRVTNLTTVTWLGGELRGANEAVFENRGTFISATGSVFGYHAGLNTATFDNQGVLIKTVGTEETVLGNFWTLHNSGRIQVMQGSLRLDPSSNGVHVFSTGSNLEGHVIIGAADGVTPVVATVEAMVTLSGGSNLEIAKTTFIEGTGGFMGGGLITWSGGGFRSSAITIAQGTTMNISGADDKFMEGDAVITNLGEIHWTGGAQISAGGVSTVVNHGLFSIEGEGELGYSRNGHTYGGVLDNRGTLRKTSNVTNRVTDWVFINRSSGVIDIQSGTLQLESGYQSALNTLESGSRLIGPGKLRLGAVEGNALLRADGTITIDAGATLELGEPSVSYGKWTVAGGGLIEWTGGTISIDEVSTDRGLTVAPDSNLSISGPMVKLIEGATVVLQGNGRWTEDGIIRISGGLFDNQGSLVIEGNGLVDYNAAGRLTNSGTFTKRSAGLTRIYDEFTNRGTVRVEAGVLAFGHGGYSRYTQLEGKTELAGGTLAAYDDQNPPEMPRDLIDIQGGSVEGQGTLDAHVTSKGIFRPGAADQAGAISILGDYTQDASGKLEIELGGATAQTEYDQLLIGGAAMIAGALEVSLIDGFMPLKAQRFDVVGYTTREGMFDTSLPAGAGLSAEYQASFLVLNGTTEPMMIAGGDAGCSCAETRRGGDRSLSAVLLLALAGLAFGRRRTILDFPGWRRRPHKSEK